MGTVRGVDGGEEAVGCGWGAVGAIQQYSSLERHVGGYMWWGVGVVGVGREGTAVGGGGGGEWAAIERDVVGAVWVGGCGWRGDRGAVGMEACGRWEALWVVWAEGRWVCGGGVGGVRGVGGSDGRCGWWGRCGVVGAVWWSGREGGKWAVRGGSDV